MTERFSINAITPTTDEWSCKVQVIDKGRSRDNFQRSKKYQLLILQDEEETQIQCVMFGSDITHYADLLHPFHTYVISVANVKESNRVYGTPINDFTWIIDRGTIVEPIEEINPPENPLPSPTRLALTTFDKFELQAEGSEFDILAIVLNVDSPTYAANGSKIQDFIIMDNQKKPIKLTLWANFIDHDGTKIMNELDQYPIILARRIGKTKSGLTTKFSTTIEINPPYPQVDALRTWTKANEHLLIAYKRRSTTSTGSLRFIPFEEKITLIADVEQQQAGQIFCIEAALSLANENQQFFVMTCSDCKKVFIRIHSRRRFYCATCHRSTNFIPKCQFEVTITDNSGSTTALITDEAAEAMLHLTAEEVYDIRHTENQMLPLLNVTTQLSDKKFSIQVKKSFTKSTDAVAGQLTVLSFMEKQTAIDTQMSTAAIDIEGTGKRKIGDDKESSSHQRHGLEMKPSSLKIYQK